MSDFFKKICRFLIKFYQKFISPLCPGCCRFRPTCSEYMLTAIEEHGVIRGIWLGTKRILRCHPWGGSGYDPVPKKSDKKK